jgi:isopenicillin N synthase-like dioxygenase
MNFSSIPVIDISGLQSDSLSDRQAVAVELRRVCHTIGFFYIANHGIPAEFTRQTFAETRRFFDLPLAQKNQVAAVNSSIFRGYDPIGAQALDVQALSDLKESFYLGVDRDTSDPLVQRRTPNHGPNQWPIGLPGWRTQMEQYFATMLELAQRLSRGIALSLDLEEQYFDRMINNTMSILRLLHYPPHPAHATPNQWGCGAHTDWGFLTILLQDQTGGLEVRNAEGDWIPAPPIPDTFVINLGDMLARWTNDYYQSTPHRVVNRSQSDRYAIPFFFDVNYHAIVECLPSCCGPTNPPKYAPIQAGDHIIAMYNATNTQPQLV